MMMINKSSYKKLLTCKGLPDQSLIDVTILCFSIN